TPAQRRERADRESLLWPRGAQAAGRVVAAVCAAHGWAGLPPGLRLVDVFDRGGDSFEFLDDLDAHNRSYVGRAKHDRHIRVGHAARGPPGRPRAHRGGRPARGRNGTTPVRSHAGGPQRRATVVLWWAAVTVRPPHQQCGHSRRLPLRVWAVRVWEPNPPRG